jgi:predicted porin
MHKRILLAIALAGLSQAVQAQSNITLFGLVDAGFINDKLDGRKTINGINSGILGQSRWGIRGTEDLGNGLKAKFWLESGFTVDNGTNTQGRLFGRQAYVALESSTLGEISLGRQQNLEFKWLSGIASPFGPSWSRSAVSTVFAYNDGDYGDDGRLTNSVYYFSPGFGGGFHAAVGYSFNAAAAEVAGSSQNHRVADAALRYSAGKLKAIATYQNANPVGNAKNASSLALAATYDFGLVAVHGGINRSKNPLSDPDGGNFATGFVSTGHTSDIGYSVGVSVPIGAGKVLASYQATTQSDISSYNLGYLYSLSKRTDLYALLNKTETHNFVTNADRGRRQAAVGIQHRF